MKKYFAIALSLITMIGCVSKPAEQSAKRGNGYTESDTDNIKLVKALNDASMKYDTTLVRSFYSSGTDSVHMNLVGMTIDQNISLMNEMQKQGITTSIESYSPIWETINDKPSEKGVTNYVIAYMKIIIKKGDKSTRGVFNQVCAIKDNKIVEEWDIYDTKVFEEFMK